MDHFLAGCYLRRKIRFMAKSQLFKPPAQFIYTHGGVISATPRSAEQGAVGAVDPRCGGLVAICCEEWRSRTGRIRRARQARHRAPGRTERRDRGADRDLRLGQDPQLETPAFPGDHRPVRRSAALRRDRRADSDQQQAVADEILDEIKGLYNGLEQYGRRGVVARVPSSAARPPDRRNPDRDDLALAGCISLCSRRAVGAVPTTFFAGRSGASCSCR